LILKVDECLSLLHGGVPPTEEEIVAVLDAADNDKSGAVSIDELKDVIRIWRGGH
jgi:Ca2+-binding EF-hand superfamily protein